jgi:hypothetical protein
MTLFKKILFFFPERYGHHFSVPTVSVLLISFVSQPFKKYILIFIIFIGNLTTWLNSPPYTKFDSNLHFCFFLIKELNLFFITLLTIWHHPLPLSFSLLIMWQCLFCTSQKFYGRDIPTMYSFHAYMIRPSNKK